ncbi:hypothetical protein [Streptomyces beihaiensis]|uniref:WXG100 family type VII secretion target n=1 Tax=Streptomyces beihaiensis TaxID=2984495 RepID=A0ABT3TXK4_9ACTN|nr:hypothetical protein [Streptomyces beihaiensis]MCX3061779.1 hypothetical protein [Streptomyces beihaiensis]
MTLAVEPNDLTGYAGQVRRAHEDFTAATSYMSSNTTIGFSCSGGLWDKFFIDHVEKTRQTKDIISRFSTVLGSSEKELGKTATWYQTVDLAQARKLDATYPGTSRPSPVHRTRPRPGSGSTFQDVCDATGQLKPAGSANGWIQGHMAEFDFAPANKTAGTLLDIASPTSLVNEGLKLAFDIDILGTASNWLTGDWQSYASCADAWHCMGNFCADVAANLMHGNQVLATTWRGNAADAAWKYFDNLARKLDAARDAFHSLRDHYKDVAAAVFSLADVVKGAIVNICDLAAQAAIGAAASTATAATGVGLLGSFVGAAFVAERVSAMVEEYGRLVANYEKVVTALTGALGSAGFIAELCTDLKKFPVVGNAYDNALV